MIALLVRAIIGRTFGEWGCRWRGHMWWTIDYDDDIWGAYEMVSCRRCGDWMFAQ